MAWGRERLDAILGCPSAPDILDDGSSPPILWHWPSLVAISGVLLLALDGNDLLARRIVAEQIVGLRGNRIALTLRYGFRERRSLGEDWDRMQGLAVIGAALRSVGHPAVDPPGDLLRSWSSRLSRWFIHRKIRPNPSWEKVSIIALRLRERLYRKEDETRVDEFAPQQFMPVSIGDPGFDLAALEEAFAWLPPLEVAHDEDECHKWIHLHRELLGVAERMRQGLERLGPDANFGSWGSDLLSDYERWLSPYLARLIPQLETAGDRQSFWEPALRSFSGRDFTNAWFSEGLQAAGTPENFATCWEEMISYALSSPAVYLDTAHILGMEWSAMKALSEEYRPALRRLIPLFEQWAMQELRRGRDVQRLADFLLRPAALDFVCPGICWLRGALPKLRSQSREEEEERLDHALVDVLRVGWTHFQSRIRADKTLLEDFQDRSAGSLAVAVPPPWTFRKRSDGR